MGLSNYYSNELERFLTKEENKRRLKIIEEKKKLKKRLKEELELKELNRQNKMFEEEK